MLIRSQDKTKLVDITGQTIVVSGVNDIKISYANSSVRLGHYTSKEKAINMMNSILRDTEYDSTYRVDFILDINHVTIPLIIKLSQFEDIICQGIDEPMLAIENISLTRDCFEVFGKNEDTISFMVNDIKYIQFKCKEGNQLYDFLQSAWDDNDSITFNIVGKPSINEYNGIRTPQIIIKDVAVISTNSNDEDDDW